MKIFEKIRLELIYLMRFQCNMNRNFQGFFFIISEHFIRIFISYRWFGGTEKSLPFLNYGPLTFQFVCVISFLLFRCLRHSINLESNSFPLYLNLKKKVPSWTLGHKFSIRNKICRLEKIQLVNVPIVINVLSSQPKGGHASFDLSKKDLQKLPMNESQSMMLFLIAFHVYFLFSLDSW